MCCCFFFKKNTRIFMFPASNHLDFKCFFNTTYCIFAFFLYPYTALLGSSDVDNHVCVLAEFVRNSLFILIFFQNLCFSTLAYEFIVGGIGLGTFVFWLWKLRLGIVALDLAFRSVSFGALARELHLSNLNFSSSASA